jgi:LemA protein
MMYIIIGGLVVLNIIVLIFGIGIYNKLVKLQNRYENAFAQIDVQLKRRHDLIPNLIETAKGYMDHEKETFQAVTEARNQAVQAEQKAAESPSDPQAMQQLSQAESMLSEALGQFRVTVEDYPELKANESMNKVMEELTTTENKISFARQAFNDAVTKYNNKRETFPNNFLAGVFNFQEAELFEVEIEEQKEAPEVSFE